MKTKSIKRFPIHQSIAVGAMLAALFLQFAVPSAFAAGSFYWDNNTTTAGFGTAGGTWSSAGSTLWNGDPLGGSAGGLLGNTITTASSDTSENFGTASYGLAAGTVTVSGTVNSGPIIFGSQSGAIVLLGGTITLPAAATITVNNASDTISSVIAGASTSLTKAGAGTLTISGNNAYTGTTTISGGTLFVNSPGSLASGSAVTVTSGTTLGGNGTINGSVNVSTGGMLSPGASGFGNIGTLTLANGLTLNGNTIYSDLPSSGTTCDLIALTGNLVLNGANTIFLNASGGAIPAGTYTLMSYTAKTGSGTLTFPNGSATMNNATLTVGSTSVTVTVAASTYFNWDVWKGTVSGVWDGGILNWTRNGTASQGYTAGDAVTFDDTGSAGTTISSGSPVSPASVLFNNSVNNYTVSAIIAGSGTALIKNGSGTTTLSGNNTYTGPTMVNAGTLSVTAGYFSTSTTINVASGATLTSSANNSFTAGGTSQGGAWTIAGTINGSSGVDQIMPASVTLNNGTMGGAAYASYGTFLCYNAPTTITANGSGNNISAGNIGNGNALTFSTPLTTDALTISGYIGASSALNGSVTKSGLGTLTLNGVNTYTGATTVNAGTLTLSSSAELSSSALTVASGATLNFNCYNDITATAWTISGTINNLQPGFNSQTMPATVTLNNGTLSGAANGAGNPNYGTYFCSGSTITANGNANTISAGNIGLGTLTVTTPLASDALTVSGVLGAAGNAGGSLTKSGSGTLTISGTEYSSGTTTFSVNGGTLLVNSPGSLASGSAVTVASGATLGGNGTINGTVTANAGATLSPGSAANTIGTLTLANSGSTALTLKGNSTILCDLPTTGTTCDKISVAGTLVLNGTTYVVLNAPNGAVPANTYTIMTYGAQSGSGSILFPNGTTTMGNATLSVGSTSVTIIVASGGLTSVDTWSGSVSGVWDGGILNWNKNGTASQAYASGDSVIFDDTGSVAATISSGAAVSPASVFFNNSADSYTVSAIIGGTGPLIKNGSGTTTLSAAAVNTYTGPTTVNGGTLTLGTSTKIATSSSITVASGATLNINNYGPLPTTTWTCSGTINNVNSGLYYSQTMPTTLTLNNGTLSGAQNTAGNPNYGTFLAAGTITANGNANTISAGNIAMGNLTVNTPLATDALTVSSVLGTAGNSSGAVTKSGLGTLTLSSSGNIYTGGTTINASGGTLQIGGAGKLNGGSYAGVISIGSSSTLKYSSSASQTLSGNITGSGALTKDTSSTSTLTLSGSANAYTGDTTISAGTLALSSGGTISGTANIILASGATFDVSAPTTALALGAGQTLKASATGANTTGTITVASGKNLTLSAGGLAFTAYGAGSSTAPLTVNGASAGALAMNSAPVTVTSTTPLAAGTYTLVAKSGSATVTGTPGALTINGNGAVGSASVAVTGNQLILTIANPTAPSISASPTAQSACVGSTASFSVTATSGGSGNAPNYSWSKVGSGWGNSWSVSGGGGVYRGTSTGNENGGGACTSFTSANDINSPSGNALGIYGGTTPEIATRTFTALTAGQVVSIDVDNGGVDSGKRVGFSLQTSLGADVLQFYFLGGQSNYKYNDGTERDTGIGYIRTGSRVQFVLNDATHYTLIVQTCGGSATYFYGTYSGTIAKLKLFNENTSTGAANDAFFNNFIVGGYVDNADNYTGTGSWASLDNGAQSIATGNGSSSYTTPATAYPGDNGNQYQVVVYNSGGAVLSSAATLTVNSQSTITSQPVSQTRAVGNNVTFSVTATGGSPAATYQWQKNGANISGANSASYTINNVQTTDAANSSGYSCVVSNGTCFQSSSAATLAVNVVPTISGGGQPANASACSGSSASFTNTPATGASTASYQWRQRGAGWDSAGWVLTGAVVNQAGAFVGSATNNNATTSPTDSNLDGDINTAGRAWAMFANSSQTMNAERVSSNSLATSQTVQLDLDNGAVQSGASAGFSLKAGSSNVRFEFIADGSSQTYKLTDNSGVAAVATSVPLTKEGVRVTFTLTAANTYSVSFTTLVDGVVHGPYTGTLASSGSIDCIRVYNFNSGANSGSDLLFNNLTFGSNSDNAADSAYDHGGTPTLSGGDNGGGLNLSTSGIYTITSDSTKSVLTVNPATANTTYDVVVSAAGAPSVTSTAATLTVNALPTPTAGNNGPVCVGTPLSLTSSGGVGYTWSGPNGFSSTAQNPTVNASTTLAMAGTYTVIVTNASGCTASTTTAVTVNSNPTITETSPLPAATFGQSYSHTVSATGAAGYSATDLPLGLTINSGSGLISGMPTVTGTSNVVVTVTNFSGCSDTKTLSLTVNLGASTITLTGSSFTYNDSAHSPSIGISGSIGARATNYVGTGSTSYASASAPVNVGTYDLTVSVLSDAHYYGATNSQAFTNSQPSTFVGASSTNNPSGYKDSVTFLATLPADATGSVVFSSTNGAFSTNSVSAGVATSLAITNLPRGTNVITVAYLGDGNYFGSTNNTLLQVVTNHPPVASVMTLTYTAGLPAVIALSDLATNWNDVDGDPVELTAFSPATTNGVTLFPINLTTNVDGSYVITNIAYLGYDNSANVNDQFSYSISDGQGGTNIGYVNLVVNLSVTGTNSIVGIGIGNPTTLRAYGIPGYTYITERATNLAPPIWVDIATNTAATNGVINVFDTFWDLGSNQPASAFYKLKWQQP